MQREWKSPRGRGRPPRDVSPTVAELSRRFAMFREEHPSGTRIPPELREAVVSAVARGAALGPIERACRISRSQIIAWRAGGPFRSGEKSTEDPPARIFSVVDEVLGAASPPSTSTVEQELEFRLGPWSVKVKLIERGR
jgi:hypothetical protein